jgi:hypothetical protein
MDGSTRQPARAVDGPRLLGVAAGVTFAVAVAYSFAWTSGQKPSFQKGDFGAYYRAGQAVAAGRTPYFVDENGPTETFVYAPAYAFLFQPFSQLDYCWGARAWMLVNWALTIVCVCLGLELVVGSGWRRQVPWDALWLALLPLVNFFWSNIRSGQVGILVLVCCLGWAVCARRGKPFLGGMLLAAGCALKLAPGLLLPYLVIRRDFRGLAGVLAGSALLFALPALWVGWDGTVRLHEEWPRHCSATQIAAQTCHPMNQSFLGLLARLPWISNGGTCFSLENLHALERSYFLVLLCIAAAAYGWIFWARRRTRDAFTVDEERHRDNSHLALLLILMTMAHVRAWVFNYVALFPACLILADRIVHRLPGWKTALAALVAVVLISPLCWPDPFTPGWSLLAWFMQGKFFWIGVAVASACWWCSFNRLRFGTREEPGEREAASGKVLTAT